MRRKCIKCLHPFQEVLVFFLGIIFLKDETCGESLLANIPIPRFNYLTNEITYCCPKYDFWLFTHGFQMFECVAVGLF